MRVKDRLGYLRQRQQAAAAIDRKDGPDAYEREARAIYGLLREAWEQAVHEVLLNDVVEPYRPSVQTQKVRVLHDVTDCKIVDAGMTECSRWLLGHDQPAADNSPCPPPEELLRAIQRLEDWRLTIVKRR